MRAEQVELGDDAVVRAPQHAVLVALIGEVGAGRREVAAYLLLAVEHVARRHQLVARMGERGDRAVEVVDVLRLHVLAHHGEASFGESGIRHRRHRSQRVDRFMSRCTTPHGVHGDMNQSIERAALRAERPCRSTKSCVGLQLRPCTSSTPSACPRSKRQSLPRPSLRSQPRAGTSPGSSPPDPMSSPTCVAPPEPTRRRKTRPRSWSRRKNHSRSAR